MVLAAPFRGDPFWDPMAFSWATFGILLAIAAVLTVGFLVWTVLQPDQPDHGSGTPLAETPRQDRELAARVLRELDADAGRSSLRRASIDQDPIDRGPVRRRRTPAAQQDPGGRDAAS